MEYVIGYSVPGNGLLDRCSLDGIGWSCGRLGRANRLGTDGGAGDDCQSTLQTVMWVGDFLMVQWSLHG